MTSRHDPSLNFASTGVFNKLLILVEIIGAAVAVLAVSVAVRGHGAAQADEVESQMTRKVQFAHLTLTESQ